MRESPGLDSRKVSCFFGSRFRVLEINIGLGSRLTFQVSITFQTADCFPTRDFFVAALLQPLWHSLLTTWPASQLGVSVAQPAPFVPAVLVGVVVAVACNKPDATASGTLSSRRALGEQVVHEPPPVVGAVDRRKNLKKFYPFQQNF